MHAVEKRSAFFYIPATNIRYCVFSRLFLLFLAKKVANSVKTDLQQQLKYYNSLSADKQEAMSEERRMADNFLKGLEQMETVYNPKIQIPGKMMAIDPAGKDTGVKKK